jgi:hypothetical protein
MKAHAIKILSILSILTIAVMVFAVMNIGLVNFVNAATSNSAVTANVNVGNVIYLSLNPNAISFGIVYPTQGTAANVPVNVIDNGGNVEANVLVAGGNWIYGSNTFLVGNTLWSATSSGSTTPLTSTPTNTMVFISKPSINTPSTQNSVYFGVNVPAGMPAGLYTENIIFESYNSTIPLSSTPVSANAVASVTVGSTCFISLSPNTINFGNIYASANVPTNMLITDSDNGGNVEANVLVEGTSWNGSSVSFGVSNTLYSPSTQSAYVGNALTSTLTLTTPLITVPAPTQSVPTSSNSIYFGLGVPPGTPAGSYTQTITIENSC